MAARCLYVFAIAAVGAAGVDAAEITSSPATSGSAAERGVVGLRCALEEEGWFATSRGAVLELGAASADVLLTTAHGLPSDAAAVKRNCRVLVRGKEYAIADVLNAGGDLEGSEHDWAVVVLEQRIAGDVHRWRPALVTREWLTKAVADGAPVRLVLRNADAAKTDCRFAPNTPDPSLLFAHSCVAHPGISGSPLVVALDSNPEPLLLGVHVGVQTRWRGTKLDFVRVARPIDAEVAAAITAAAARASPPQRR